METLHRGWSRWMSISWWHSRHHWSTFDWIWDGGQSALTSSLESSQSFSHWLFFFLVEISLFVVRSASALDVHTIFFCGFPFFSCAVTAHQKGRPPWRVRFPFWFCSYRLFVVVVVVVVVVNISFRFPLHFFFRKSSRRLSSFTFFCTRSEQHLPSFSLPSFTFESLSLWCCFFLVWEPSSIGLSPTQRCGWWAAVSILFGASFWTIKLRQRERPPLLNGQSSGEQKKNTSINLVKLSKSKKNSTNDTRNLDITWWMRHHPVKPSKT